MDINKKINEEVEKTLQSLNHLEKAETDPFFYTRLEARLKNKESKNQALQPRFTFALVSTIFIMIVSLTFLFYLESPSTTTGAENTVEEELYEEYGLTSFTFYQNDNSNEQ